jgi:Mg-chelatase subunit ChlD
MNTQEKTTHIAMVLDRSGSMASIADDIVGGVNTFVKQQREQVAGRATMTLVQFDGEDPYEVVYAFTPLAGVPPLTDSVYQPRGSTPLFDAVGRTINNVANWLAGQPEAERPQQIVIAIVTDGMENASREFSFPVVKQMIAEKKNLLGWQFVFLSADLGAVEQAMALGVAREATMAFDSNAKGVDQAFVCFSRRLVELRDGHSPHLRFNEADRATQKKEAQRT